MPLQRLSGVSSISRRYVVKPWNLDDVCYTLYRMFKDKAANIAYEKPSCNHMFVIGNHYEVRLFINSLREVQLTIVADLGKPFSSTSVKSVQKIFNDIDSAFSKYSEEVGSILVALRTSIKVKRINLVALEKILRDVGVAVDSKEVHSVSDVDVAVVKGRIVGKNLRNYLVTITLLYDDGETEINFAVEAEACNGDVAEHIIELQGILFSVVEYVALGLSIDEEEAYPIQFR